MARQEGSQIAVPPGLREAMLLAWLAACGYCVLALVSYSPDDPGWTYSGAAAGARNLMGLSGAWLADVSFSLLGYMSYLVPAIGVLVAWHWVRPQREHWDLLARALRLAGFVLILFGGSVLLTLHVSDNHALPAGPGGLLGGWLSAISLSALNLTGLTLIALAAVVIGFSLMTGISWLWIIDHLGRVLLTGLGSISRGISRRYDNLRDRRNKRRHLSERQQVIAMEVQRRLERDPPKIKSRSKPALSTRPERERQQPLFEALNPNEVPPLDLLESGIEERGGYSEESLEAMSRLLELKLKDFGVDAEVVAVHPGPVITRFEVQPAPGVKGSRITSLVKDLARSLAVVSVRIVEVIPGKSVVGIEIPNEHRELVRLHDLVASNAYESASSPLSLVLGKDIGGHPVVVDLTRMPHLLIAGTTGSGKSVGVNAMLLSILFKATPDQVRLILVDPKMLELAVYEGIPHLLTPVVTDMKDAASALRWCVGEMERRYRLMAALGVRNMAGLNRKVRDADKRRNPIADPLWEGEPDEAPALTELPYIVVVVDEFADMMMIVGKKVEQLIARIAQKARAAGIHLILATQRPSVDVITGLIKANISTRISYQVSSRIDSRVILDQGGAEQLLGHGDMLYLPAGTGVPVRVHGAFVSDDEVHRVARDWNRRGNPEYVEDVIQPEAAVRGATLQDMDDPELGDELYDQAVEFVLESRRASISAVQRRLRVGYNRAARLIEAMEAAGVVSSMSTNGSREVLVPKRETS
ncbi:MAG: DNA translocase FtsK 4TM domain-containing protein [Pseudomonadales bacterium]